MFSLRAALLATRPPVATRSIITSTRVQSGGSHMSDNDPNILEREKHRNLHEKHDDSAHPHKKHAPGWSEPLASESEAHIKADQADIESPQELQKATTDYIKKRHHAEGVAEQVAETVSSAMHKVADKVSEVLPNGTSTDAKDEVGGPLGNYSKKK
ncbi:hypothetical protein FRB96_002495 [Tulasnella sp. 330]|nr:hypothetical protein FRB96_002495 [Tulasnella sp. 330]